MSLRVAICVTLILLIALLLFSPVPVGRGSFSSVYGPATTLRAYRAALQLQSVVADAFIVVLSFTKFLSSLSELSRLIAPNFDVTAPLSSVSSILRC